jgi:general secretion pathway protein D
VITTTSTSTGFVSESVNYVDVGLKLDVEPTIYLDEDVGIKVNLEVSSIVREVLSKTGSLSYQIGTRGANTTLRLKDGETQILAGLISSEERSTANKVPLLGELPLIGRLFKSQKDDSQRSEILLSITPRIIRSIKRPDLMLAEFDSGTDTNIGAEELSLKNMPAEKNEILNSPEAQSSSSEVDSKNVSKPNPEVVKPIQVNQTGTDAKASPAEVFSNVTFGWELPAQIKVGEQFSAVLTINSPVAIRNLPVLIGFEPQVMQLVNVQEGDFFKQNNGETRFTQRSDAQGKVFASVVRQSDSAIDSGTNGIGKVLTVTFKALKATTESGTKLQLLSASPEPALPNPVKLPVEKFLQIVP